MNPNHVIRMLLLFWMLVVQGQTALAQAPVEDARQRQDAILQGQQKTSAAYRELQQAEYAVKQAEQDYQRFETEYKTAQKRADDLKRPLDTAKKSLDAAKAKEVLARKSYDAAVNAVDQTSQKPLQK